MGFFGDVVDAVVDVATAVISTAVEWVYKGLVVLLDIALPKEKAEKVASVLTKAALIGGAAFFFYWGYNFLYAGPKAASLVKTVALTALSTPLGLVYGAGRVGPLVKWMKGLYAWWAVTTTYRILGRVPAR